MILSFRHKGLQKFFETGKPSGIPAQQARRIGHILAVLHTSNDPLGMNLPGFRLHPLKGDRKGEWAVSVTGNRRIVFEFLGDNAINVDFVDYH